MYKNQLQELAQRSCFNLPSYTCFREGPDHAPRFKVAVNFNGETFESPNYCSTLRQAEHSAAEVALNALSCRGPSNALAVRIMEETGVYKNLLQEVSQRVGASLPTYTTFKSGAGHLPIFTCTVELAGVVFTGEPAKNKKQAEKNAAMSAWLSLKSLVQQSESSSAENPHKDEQEHVVVARALQKYIIKARLARVSFPIKFPTINPRPSTTQHTPPTSSKILPFLSRTSSSRNRPVINKIPIYPKAVKTAQNPPKSTIISNESHSSSSSSAPQKFPAVGAAPYIPVSRCYPSHSVAPPVTIRNSVPVFSAPPFPSPQSSVAVRPQNLHSAPPPAVNVRQAVPLFAAPRPSVKVEYPQIVRPMVSRAESLFLKMPMVRVAEPIGSKATVPKSETMSSEVEISQPEAMEAQMESIISMITDALDSPKPVSDEELPEIEDMKDLKI